MFVCCLLCCLYCLTVDYSIGHPHTLTWRWIAHTLLSQSPLQLPSILLSFPFIYLLHVITPQALVLVASLVRSGQHGYINFQGQSAADGWNYFGAFKLLRHTNVFCYKAAGRADCRSLRKVGVFLCREYYSATSWTLLILWLNRFRPWVLLLQHFHPFYFFPCVFLLQSFLLLLLLRRSSHIHFIRQYCA